MCSYISLDLFESTDDAAAHRCKVRTAKVSRVMRIGLTWVHLLRGIHMCVVNEPKEQGQEGLGSKSADVSSGEGTVQGSIPRNPEIGLASSFGRLRIKAPNCNDKQSVRACPGLASSGGLRENYQRDLA